MKSFTVGSLFAGVGGICLGFQQAKTKQSSYKLVWANEIDPYACETYKKNFNHVLLEGDIKKILHPENIKQSNGANEERACYEDMKKVVMSQSIDILTGGFPCQAFSIAGERKGFKDDRGNLFLYICELIELLGKKQKKPRVLFLENVKNLKTHDGGRTYKIIKEKLEECGYTIHEKIINTMDYSELPQNRERIYIIGFLFKKDSDKFKLFEDDILLKFKNNKEPKDRKKDVANILDYRSNKENLRKYYYSKKRYPLYYRSKKELSKNSDK